MRHPPSLVGATDNGAIISLSTKVKNQYHLNQAIMRQTGSRLKNHSKQVSMMSDFTDAVEISEKSFSDKLNKLQIHNFNNVKFMSRFKKSADDMARRRQRFKINQAYADEEPARDLQVNQQTSEAKEEGPVFNMRHIHKDKEKRHPQLAEEQKAGERTYH